MTGRLAISLAQEYTHAVFNGIEIGASADEHRLGQEQEIFNNAPTELGEIATKLLVE